MVKSSDADRQGQRMGADLLGLVRSILNGDESAWEQFLPVFYEIGHRSLRTFRLSGDDQDELLSQALSIVYAGGLKSFHGASLGELVSYLSRIVRNEALTFIKKQKREELDPDIGNSLPSAHNLENRIADEECLRILEDIVQNLPFQDKELYMRVYIGLKVREIAEQTGEPLGTVGARISRLKDRIREILRGHGCS
ncbi:MAG: RNA polymerase sigma factor [Thermodesulfobacteriota bacterium]